MRRTATGTSLAVAAVLVAALGGLAAVTGRMGAIGEARNDHHTDAAGPARSPWPDASTTGVPSGTFLTDYAGSCTVTTGNTVIDAKRVSCPDGLTIRAANVSITKSSIKGPVRLDPDSPGYDESWALTITDTEIDAGQAQLAAICCGNLIITRANLHGGVTGAQCEELSKYCLVRDSYLHSQYRPENKPWHLGGFLSDGTAGAACARRWCIELVHNTVHCDAKVNRTGNGCTGDINLIPNFAKIQKVLVRNNLLKASADLAFCTFGGEKRTSPFDGASEVVYQDNVFERGSANKCGAFGPATDFDTSGAGNVWAGNEFDDGAAVPAP